jgi:hypothetical protein
MRVLSVANSDLSSLLIPAGVCEIGRRALSGCETLSDAEFDLDSQCITIGAEALCGRRLQRIEIPASVRKIEECAFYGCE